MHGTSAEMLGPRAQETSFFEVSERRLSFLTPRVVVVAQANRNWVRSQF